MQSILDITEEFRELRILKFYKNSKLNNVQMSHSHYNHIFIPNNFIQEGKREKKYFFFNRVFVSFSNNLLTSQSPFGDSSTGFA